MVKGREHAGAYKWGCTNRMEQTIGRAGSRCVGCAGVGACDMSVETGLAEGPVHYGRIVEKHWVDER